MAPSKTEIFEVPKLDNSIYYDPKSDNILYNSPTSDLVEEVLIQGVPKSQLLISSKTDISFHKIRIKNYL